jgi:hypothetical protein
MLVSLGVDLAQVIAAGIVEPTLEVNEYDSYVIVEGRALPVHDVTFRVQQSRIDVTTALDAAPVYMPGLRRVEIAFRMDATKVTHDDALALVSGAPAAFAAVIGDVSVSTQVFVRSVHMEASVDGEPTWLVEASGTGEPTVTRLSAPTLGVVEDIVAPLRRAMNLGH